MVGPQRAGVHVQCLRGVVDVDVDGQWWQYKVVVGRGAGDLVPWWWWVVVGGEGSLQFVVCGGGASGAGECWWR